MRFIRMWFGTRFRSLTVSSFFSIVVVCLLSRKDNIHNESGPKDPHLILLWTAYWTSPTWDYTHLGTKPFEHELCKYKCNATADKSLLHNAAAVLYHFYDSDPLPRDLDRSVPRVLAIHEPPSVVNPVIGNLQRYDNQVQLVMSYRYDSDLYAPYRVILPLNQPTSDRHPRVPLKDRPRNVVSVISNCNAASHRELYVRELAKYIDVDIYGKCGTLYCDKNDWANCMRKFESTYKFYLSFENSVCDDYVSEKLFEPLRVDIIPVYLGGRHKDPNFPLGSRDFINTQEYRSPKDLAMYLREVASDEKKFDSYFESKNSYKVLETHGPLTPGLCTLCEWLHTNDERLHRNYRTDVSQWWMKGTCYDDLLLKQSRTWN